MIDEELASFNPTLLDAIGAASVTKNAATGEKPSASKLSPHPKVSRRKQMDDLAQAESHYYEAKTRFDALHHTGRGLTFEQAQQRVESAQALQRRAEATLDREQAIADSLPPNIDHGALEEARLARDNAAAALDGFRLMADALSPDGDALRAEATTTLNESADALHKACADALPPVAKRRKSKSPRALVPRDSYPSDYDRFGRWLHHRVEEFDTFRKGEEIRPSIPSAGINPVLLAEKTEVPADNIRMWVMAVVDRKLKYDPLYPTNAQKRACMNYCANHLGYFEPGLAPMNRLVQYLLLVMEQRGISNESLARATCLSARTIEAWGGNDPLRAPRLQDVLACFQELNLPLAPVSYEADRAFQNAAADAALKLRPGEDWGARPEARPAGPK